MKDRSIAQFRRDFQCIGLQTCLGEPALPALSCKHIRRCLPSKAGCIHVQTEYISWAVLHTRRKSHNNRLAVACNPSDAAPKSGYYFSPNCFKRRISLPYRNISATIYTDHQRPENTHADRNGWRGQKPHRVYHALFTGGSMNPISIQKVESNRFSRTECTAVFNSISEIRLTLVCPAKRFMITHKITCSSLPYRAVHKRLIFASF